MAFHAFNEGRELWGPQFKDSDLAIKIGNLVVTNNLVTCGDLGNNKRKIPSSINDRLQVDCDF